ncbi:MAG: hypothetical protein JXO51_05725 [Candidatus Aminicenantes bacterium]|nr:hypothetical protein [Candidatus Aminicenantes bacterium]
MYDVLVKRTAKGEMVMGLAEGFAVAEDERIIGRAKAVKSGKSAYFCKDKKAIFSPGDVVFLNGIEGGGGWVEIVEFVSQEAGGKDAAADDSQGARLYNEGVNLHGKKNYAKALDAFTRCHCAGFYRMQSAYAASLCQQELGVAITIPEEFKDKTGQVGTVFIGSNLVCRLIHDGHKAALAGDSAVLTVVDGSTYDIRIASFFGSFMLNAWRKESGKTIPLTDPSLNPSPTRADRYVISLVQGAASLPPLPMPDGGLPTSLE